MYQITFKVMHQQCESIFLESTRSVLVDDSSYACLHLHKRIVLTMSNKTAVKCSDVRYNFAKSICMHLLWDMCKDIA